MKDLNLDQSNPDSIAPVLRRAAQEYYSSASELESAWQDRKAGLIWEKIANIMSRAADSCDKAIGKYYR